jgi:hypothetical protein
MGGLTSGFKIWGQSLGINLEVRRGGLGFIGCANSKKSVAMEQSLD